MALIVLVLGGIGLQTTRRVVVLLAAFLRIFKKSYGKTRSFGPDIWLLAHCIYVEAYKSF
eukprot:9725474-Karenia_brevis.AAC.1